MISPLVGIGQDIEALNDMVNGGKSLIKSVNRENGVYMKNVYNEDNKAIVYEIEPQLILIRSGKFIGYLPDHFAASWVAKGQLRCLSPLTPTFNCEFDLVSKKGMKPSRALSKFISDVESTSVQSLD